MDLTSLIFLAIAGYIVGKTLRIIRESQEQVKKEQDYEDWQQLKALAVFLDVDEFEERGERWIMAKNALNGEYVCHSMVHPDDTQSTVEELLTNFRSRHPNKTATFVTLPDWVQADLNNIKSEIAAIMAKEAEAK